MGYRWMHSIFSHGRDHYMEHVIVIEHLLVLLQKLLVLRGDVITIELGVFLRKITLLYNNYW